MFRLFTCVAFTFLFFACSKNRHFSSAELKKYQCYAMGESFLMMGSKDLDTFEFKVVNIEVKDLVFNAPLSAKTYYQEIHTYFDVYQKNEKTGTSKTLVSSKFDAKHISIFVEASSCARYFGNPSLTDLSTYTLNDQTFNDVGEYGGIFYSVSKGFLKMHGCTNLTRIF